MHGAGRAARQQDSQKERSRMWEFLLDFYHQPDVWPIASILVLSALIGWATNWLAIRMTFYPVRFVGRPPWLGWQGIIPRKAEKITGIVVDNTLSRISNMKEIFDGFEPRKIVHHAVKVADSRIEEFTDDIMAEKNQVLWETLPNMVKGRFYARVRKQMPEVMDRIVQDMHDNIEELIDPKDMTVRCMQNDPALLNRVFLECADAELRLVVNSGLWFGLAFGCLQVWLWRLFPEWWLLPAAGLVIGLVTNWIALNLIFRPLNPVRIGPFRLQGLFLRRQKAVAEVFCRLVTTEVMTIGRIMDELFRGPRSDRTKAIIKKHLRSLIEGGMVKTMAQVTVGAEKFVDLRKTIEDKGIEMSLESFHDPVFSRERGLVVEKLFRERMQAMTPAEFQNLLRPAFEEDEWILILVGGVLGLLAGAGQWLVLSLLS
jgi:uncharacterized membrane protein YheB (UPF0754 family)